MTAQSIYMRTSERTTWARCRRKWFWAYHEGLSPKSKSVHLEFGDLIHQALACWYIPEKPRKLGSKAKRGEHPVKAFKRIYDSVDHEFTMKKGKEEGEEGYVSARDLGIAMLKGYLKEYGKDDWCRVISPEYTFHLPMKDKKTGHEWIYVGQVDAVYEDLRTGRLGFWEHKTAASIDKYKLDHDEQAGTYMALGKKFLLEQGVLTSKQGKGIDHIHYNFLRKVMPDQRAQDAEGRYLNLNGSISKQQPKPYFERIQVFKEKAESTMLVRRIHEQQNEMQMVRDGILPPTKSIIDGCSGMLNCEFRDMCIVEEQGLDWETMRDAMYTKWNPYAQHGIPDEKVLL